MIQRLVIAFFLAVITAQSWAHEMRPAFLEIKEITSATYNVLWKVPMRGDLRLQLDPQFPEMCDTAVPPVARSVNGAMITRWTLQCERSLADQAVIIAGLENTLTDVLARVQHLDGAVQTTRIKPGEPSFTVADSPGKLAVTTTYIMLGIDHILLGIDHLLFVFALLLIVNGVRRLVWTITAFTVAHSITLAMATLGYVNVPQAPVEAVIALSILFLAVELVKQQQGKKDVVMRAPWIVAFIFGLLHGFGFAGALAETGLPQNEIPLALLMFNVGVELGQLTFVAIVLTSGWLIQRTKTFPLHSAEMVTTYIIGSIAAYWTIERIAGFWI
jgi:hydrogenase/urease accessory protein HupE